MVVEWTVEKLRSQVMGFVEMATPGLLLQMWHLVWPRSGGLLVKGADGEVVGVMFRLPGEKR